jgi:hypothetical protein
VPTIIICNDMVGTAQMRLCPPYEFDFQTTTPFTVTASRSRRAVARVFPEHPASKNQRAQGKPGARRTRSLAWKMKKPHEHRHHRFAGITQPSLRDGFNGYFVLSPVTGLFCHRRSRNCFHKLDASVGASGPHDFAVRELALSSAAPLASTASRALRP